MSETNSAVLELKDDDDEPDSVPTSKVVDGAEFGAPLIMEDGYDIAVKVDNPIKQLSTLETFVTYRVRCVCARWPSPPYVRRRYNHFKVFHKRISAAHPLLAIPPLPPHHSALEQLDRYEQNFVALRTMALNAFLDRIVKHPILTHSEELRLFITTSECEADREFRSESALWGLPVFGTRETRTAGAQRVKDPEFSGALDYLNSLQHKLTTLNTLTSKLCKGTNAVGAEMAGLSTALTSWSSIGAAQCAGRAAASAASARRRHGTLAPTSAPELPFLAAYAAALAEKVTQRNVIHATHISGNTTEDIHNKLLQASESLRSDLADWTPKTRSDIKRNLLKMAENQINIHQHTFQAWEQALKEATAKPEDLFKTVSKNAVQNLSPAKNRKIDAIDNHTEVDIEAIDNHTEVDIEAIDNHTELDIEEFDLDSDIQELSLNEVGLHESKNVLKIASEKGAFVGSIQVEIHNCEQNSLPVNVDFNKVGEKAVNDGVLNAVNDSVINTVNDSVINAVNDVFESVNDVYSDVNDAATVKDAFQTAANKSGEKAVNDDVENAINDVFESVNDVSFAVNDAYTANDVFQSISDSAQALKVTINDNNSNLTKTCDNLISKSDNVASKSDKVASKSDKVASKSDNVVSKSDIKPEMSEKDARTLESIFENQFLDINSELSEKEISEMSVQSNLDSVSKELSAKFELKGVNATSDPLSDFTEVDLSNN